MEYYICMVTAFQFKKKNAFIILFSQSPSITYKDYYSHSEISETKNQEHKQCAPNQFY